MLKRLYNYLLCKLGFKRLYKQKKGQMTYQHSSLALLLNLDKFISMKHKNFLDIDKNDSST